MKNGVCFDGLQIELDGICGWKQLYKLDECYLENMLRICKSAPITLVYQKEMGVGE